MLGKLATQVATERSDLLAEPVLKALRTWPSDAANMVLVAPIDAELADTAAFCAAYDVALDASANCVVIAGRREGEVRYAACVVLATTRADVNGLARRHLNVRKASFAPMNEAVELTAMEYGGITCIGLPAGWPILVDAAVAASDAVVIGSGVRRSKIVLPGAALTHLPGATILDGLGQPIPA
ncbi:MAG: hypothetical protein QOE61_3613 [Micromonosporaceae bacterium]|nr:hypothetical protein [Micromonosporaceae bacterium]